jgi:hypothetical protein
VQTGQRRGFQKCTVRVGGYLEVIAEPWHIEERVHQP